MKHTEAECVKSLSRVCRVDAASKTIRAAKGSLGIKRLGKLDFLVRYCDWSFSWV